jgi:hypothetical protein
VNEQGQRTVDCVSELGEGQENHDLHPEHYMNQKQKVAPRRTGRKIDDDLHEKAGSEFPKASGALPRPRIDEPLNGVLYDQALQCAADDAMLVV